MHRIGIAAFLHDELHSLPEDHLLLVAALLVGREALSAAEDLPGGHHGVHLAVQKAAELQRAAFQVLRSSSRRSVPHRKDMLQFRIACYIILYIKYTYIYVYVHIYIYMSVSVLNDRNV